MPVVACDVRPPQRAPSVFHTSSCSGVAVGEWPVGPTASASGRCSYPCRDGGHSRRNLLGGFRTPTDRSDRARHWDRVHAAVLMGKHAVWISVCVLLPSAFHRARALADGSLPRGLTRLAARLVMRL